MARCISVRRSTWWDWSQQLAIKRRDIRWFRILFRDMLCVAFKLTTRASCVCHLCVTCVRHLCVPFKLIKRASCVFHLFVTLKLTMRDLQADHACVVRVSPLRVLCIRHLCVTFKLIQACVVRVSFLRDLGLTQRVSCVRDLQADQVFVLCRRLWRRLWRWRRRR